MNTKPHEILHMIENHFLKNNLCLSVFVFVLICVFIPLGVGGATLYLLPQSQTVSQGDTFIVEVRLDTEGKEINTVQVNLTFPQSLLEVVDFSKGDSILSFWVEESRLLNNILFIGGTPGGFKGEGRIGRIIFKGKSPGEGRIDFKEGSKALLNDGFGTLAELSTKGADFKILAEKLEIPKDQWREEIENDKIPPEPFEIIISQDPFLFEGKYFIAFSTVDKQTGIDFYQIKEGKRDWKVGESPYLLEDQSLRSVIKVKAVDKAGNERIAEYIPQEKPFPAWIIVLVLMGIGVIWFLWKKYTKKH